MSVIQFKMQPSHQAHIRPKIAKNASSKLPEAFRMPGPKRIPEVIPEESKQSHHQPQVQARQELKEVAKNVTKKGRKSQNPVLPLKAFIEKAEQLKKEVQDANSYLHSDRLSKYSWEGQQKTKAKISYENCHTLAVIRKNATGCLKKVLHVPTLTIHFLKESLISAHFDKSQLMEWITVVNQEESPSLIRVLDLYWNTPEEYYSLLYDYSDGVLLDALNDSLHTFPMSILKELATAHLTSNIGIFNSHLIMQQQHGSKVIRYLPLYEQSDFSLSELQKMKDITESQLGPQDPNNQQRTEQGFIWRLGLILLNGYLGSTILSLDLEKVSLPLKESSLVHEILNDPNSLSSLYLSLNSLEDEAFVSFLGKCLRSKKCSDKQGRAQLKHLRVHRFMAKKYNELLSLGQLIDVVDPSLNSKSQVEISKMNRIMDSVSMILQNVTSTEVAINKDNKHIGWLAKELGMPKEVDRLVAELRKVYRS